MYSVSVLFATPTRRTDKSASSPRRNRLKHQKPHESIAHLQFGL